MLYRSAMIGLFCAACASASTQQRVDDLNKDLQELRRSHALTSQRIRELDRLNQTTFLIQDSLEHVDLEVEKLARTIDDIQTQLRVVNAALFDVTPRATHDGNIAQPAVAPLPAPRQEISGSGAETPVAKLSVKQTPATLAADDRGIYQQAYEAMQGGQTDLAVVAFGDLLNRFPQSDLADNAYYWLGEIYAGMGDTGAAQTHFRKILEAYPAGNKVPDALYKLGVLAQEQGDCERAASWYRKVQEQYPWSPVAEKSSVKIQECGRTP